MSIRPRRMQIAIALEGPILTAGASMIEPGVDSAMARDAHSKPMLPFSLVKGKVREALVDLGREDLASRWFGREGSFDGGDERGNLRFTDFVFEGASGRGEGHDPIIERIAIDRATGAASGGMIAMMEAPFGYGEPATFRGSVDFIASEDEATVVAQWLPRALRWVSGFGASRSVGFGSNRGVDASPPEAVPPQDLGRFVASDRWRLRLTLDRPLCIVGRRHSRNHFESLQTISGAVLKGAVARMALDLIGADRSRRFLDGSMPQYGALGAALDSIRFSHASPALAEAASLPVEPPLSLVTTPVRDGRWFDVALDEETKLIQGVAPAFRADWKEDVHDFVRSEFGWTPLPTARRIRTAIDEQTGRAKENSLFSYGHILPSSTDADGRLTEIVWYAEIDLTTVKDAELRDRARRELAQILSYGIRGIGKTRANASLEWLEKPLPSRASSRTAESGPTHVIVLQSDFLMTDPKTVGDDGRRVKLAYEEYWNEVSGGSLKLVHCFASQSLQGGPLVRRAAVRNYEPFLVTDAGSTFVLERTGIGDADAALNRWRSSGLDLPSWVEERYASADLPLWRRCPFLPSNGYGAAAIDLECHWNHRIEG